MALVKPQFEAGRGAVARRRRARPGGPPRGAPAGRRARPRGWAWRAATSSPRRSSGPAGNREFFLQLGRRPADRDREPDRARPTTRAGRGRRGDERRRGGSGSPTTRPRRPPSSSASGPTGWCAVRGHRPTGRRRRASSRRSSASCRRPTSSSSSAATARSCGPPGPWPRSTCRCSGSTSARSASCPRPRPTSSRPSWRSSPAARSRSRSGWPCAASIRPAGRPRRPDEFFALNDVVVARGALARVVRLDVDDRAVPPRDVHRRRADRRQPDRLDRLLVLGRRPDPRPVSRNLIVTPIAGYLSAIRSVVVSPSQMVHRPGRRRLRGAGQHRRARGPPGRRRRRRRGVGRSRADPLRRAGRGGPVLGPPPAEGRAAALVTRRPGRDGSLELAVTRPRPPRAPPARARRRAQRHHRRDRRRQEPAHRRPRPRPRRPRRPGLVRHGADGGPRRGALRPPARSRSIVVREVARRGRSIARLDDETGDRGAAGRDRRAARRDPRPARAAAAARRALAARPARRVRRLAGRRGRRWPRRSSAGGRTRRRWPSWRSSRASWSGGSRSPSTRRPRSRAARLRAGEAAEIRARLGRGPPRRGDRPRRRRDPRRARSGEAAAARASRRRGRRTRPRSSPGSTPRYEPLAERLAGLDAELEDVASEIRDARRGGRARPGRVAGSRSGCRSSTPSSAATATTRRRPRPRRGEAAEADRLRGLEGERDRRRAEDAALLAEVAVAAAALSAPAPRGGRAGSAAAVERRSASLGFGRTGFEVALGRRPAGRDEPAVEVDGDAAGLRRDRDRRGRLPDRPEPRRAGPAAGEDRVRRRAVAGRPRDRGGPRGRRRDADPRLRRDRRAGSADGARTRSAGACGPRPPPPGPVRDPPAPDRGPRRRPLRDRQAGARRADGDRGPTPRRRRAGSSSWPRCSAARPAARRRGRGAASCSSGRRPGGARRSARAAAGRRRRDGAGRRPAARAGRSSAGRSRPSWSTCGSSAASRRRRSRAYAGGPGRPSPRRPASRPGGRRAPSRRSATSPRSARPAAIRARRACGAGRPPIRGFYRFASARSSSTSTSPPGSTCRASRGCPRRSTSTRPSGSSRRPAARRADEPVRLRDRALLELLYAAGLRISEALGLDRDDLSLDGGFVRVIGKGDRERLVPVGDVALAWLARYLDDVAAGLAGARTTSSRPRRPALPQRRGRRLGRNQAWASSSGRPRRPAWATGSRRTRSATRSRRTCWRAGPTCASYRSCSGMRVSPRRSSTRT